MAARANIFENEEKAGLLARPHNTIRAVEALHPDRPAEHSAILNSLCQFDVYGALVVIGERGKPSTGNFYTNFARYYSQRSAPAFRAVVGDLVVRGTLLDGDDRLLADAISTIASYADHEGPRFDGWTGLHDQTVTDFVDKHGTPPHVP